MRLYFYPLRNKWCPNQDTKYPGLLVIIGALTRFISPGLVGTEPSVYTVTQPLHYTPTVWPLRLESMVTRLYNTIIIHLYTGYGP